jgi:hypothetical protein
MLDAETAARAVLAGRAAGDPKSGTSSVEMIRHLKIARDAAVKARTQAMLTIKSIIVGAPADLREQLERVRGRVTLVRHLAALRPGPIIFDHRVGEGSTQGDRATLARAPPRDRRPPSFSPPRRSSQRRPASPTRPPSNSCSSRATIPSAFIRKARSLNSARPVQSLRRAGEPIVTG